MKNSCAAFILLLACIILVAAGGCRNEKIITLRSLLKDMASPEAITRFPEPSYKLVQQSSYDRKSIHPDSTGWFANDDYTQFIREEKNEGRREFVMFEAEGPGAVVRWWMTFGNADALESYIRVYIDGDPVPVLEGMAPDLVGGGILAPEPLSVLGVSHNRTSSQGIQSVPPSALREKLKDHPGK